MILQQKVPSPAGLDRGRSGDRERVHSAARRAALDWSPGVDLAATWSELARFGRRDLVLARLVEGHIDALSILTEAGRKPVEGAVYGVWASRSQGTGLKIERHGPDRHLSGHLRYCTGARWVDRALVTGIGPAGEMQLLDLAVGEPGWRPVEGSWAAVGMDLSDSVDVDVDVVAVEADFVAGPGFYLDRPGFALGGVGVAAVWLGGAAGVLDTVIGGLRRFEPDSHQLAHLGAMAVAVSAADAVLERAASAAAAEGDLSGAAMLSGPAAMACRAAVDAAVEVVLLRAPRLTGPTPLCRDGDFAHRMADLGVYVRQQHAERDLAQLGARVVEGAALDA